uniref:Photosynthesis system II assembly factor Ycf48/Hcf136-like domain-containing protein n=1 Tax=viral metagenome TaxID=1070528 RepID=A0A6C0I537_9ZZZZ
MSISYLPPHITVNGLYSGPCYAFDGSGGYTVQQGFNEIMLKTPDLLNKYDVTDAIQLKFSVQTMNKKLSIMKDPSNSRTIQAWFNPITEKLYTDSIKLCACDFIDGINYQSVVSMGKMATLYKDFNKTVSTYFGSIGGFMSLFSNAETFSVNGGVFDASAYLQVINSSTFNMQGSFVSDLSGYVTISDINNLLDWVVDGNIFNNRDPAVYNYGIIDGFIAGDLIYIPNGFTITLSVNIQTESILPINNVGPSYLDAIRNKLNWTRNNVVRRTTYSRSHITQTTTFPILLILTNTPVQNYLNYGTTWTLVPGINSTDPSNNSPNNNWLSISLSSTGRYQSAIDESGNIYTTQDHGMSWSQVHGIGHSPTNSVSISFTGENQTASNGQSIYVSNDYGSTWHSTFTGGTSKIFVSICLTGQYQTVVSCGDTVYLSDDYGQTWTPIDNTSDLYFSVEAFPTACAALSYDGRYQTIVTENIYISSDYGETWTNVSPVNNLDDRNWDSVAMSSDGHYQTAIENGGEIYVSNDFGETWLFVDNPIVTDKLWESISISATGQYQTALEKGGSVFVSRDYGVTWEAIADPALQGLQWQSVSVSSDGLYQTAVTYGGQMYISTVLSTVVTTGGTSCICD